MTLAAQFCPRQDAVAVARALCFISKRQLSCARPADAPWLLTGRLFAERFCSSLEGHCGGKYQQRTHRQALPGSGPGFPFEHALQRLSCLSVFEREHMNNSLKVSACLRSLV